MHDPWSGQHDASFEKKCVFLNLPLKPLVAATRASVQSPHVRAVFLKCVLLVLFNTSGSVFS